MPQPEQQPGQQQPEQVGTVAAPDGVRLRVAESGTAPGPTLHLVHGWTQDLRTWDRVVAGLRAAGVTHRIVRHDHRGHGGSGAAPGGTTTIAQAADDLAALIDATAPEGPLVLAGHSMGGMAVMALAERHPELVASRVAGVALVSTSSEDMADLTLGLEGSVGHLVARGEHVLGPWVAGLGHAAPPDRADDRTDPGGQGATVPARPGARGWRWRAAALAPGVRALVFGRHPRRDDVLAVAEQALAAHPPSVAGFRASIAEHDRTSSLAALGGVPVSILVGDRDRLCPGRHARVIAAALPDADVAWYPGAGHMLTFERPTEVAAHLWGLLEHAARRERTPSTGSEAGPRVAPA